MGPLLYKTDLHPHPGLPLRVYRFIEVYLLTDLDEPHVSGKILLTTSDCRVRQSLPAGLGPFVNFSPKDKCTPSVRGDGTHL